MRTSMAFLAFCFFLASAAAQNVRPSTNLSSGAAASFDAMPATSGNMSVVCQVNEANAVVCYTSDGRGLTWSAPVQVDSGASADRKDLNDPSYVAFGSGSNLYCIWDDRRIDGSTPHLFFNSSADGGASWGTEAELFAADITGARMNVSPGTPDTIYICVQQDFSNDQLHLLTSHDGGATFSSTAVTDGKSDVDYWAMQSSGNTVHIVYDDNVAGKDDVYYLRSSDGGATFDVGPVVIDNSGAGAGNSDPGLGVAIDGSLVAVSTIDDIVEGALYVNVSTDGGTTFNGSVQVGGYTVDAHDADNSRIMTSGPNIIVTWEDNRNGSDEVFAATSADNGATWTEAASFGIGGFPRGSNLSGSAQDGCAIGFTGGGFPEDANGAISQDHGLTFTPVTYSDTTGDADYTEIAWNSFYNNYVVTWLSDDAGFNDAYVGGVRPQTLTPIGWVPGPTQASFDVSGFEPSTGSAWVIGSLKAGNLPLPDGRNSGLAYDVWTRTTIKLATVGAYSTALVNGAGSTPPIKMNFTGFTFHFIAVGITGASVGEVTDVFEVNL